MKKYRSLLLGLLLCISCGAKYKKTEENFRGKKVSLSIFKDYPSSFATVVDCAKFFLGKPYKKGTLEVGSDSILVVNLLEFDCTTLVENVVALHALDSITKNDFCEKLTKIRYRNSKTEGYSSRLHYFSEWISSNEQKGFLKDITQEIGGVAVKKQLNFMSLHRNLYPALKDETAFQKMLKIEQQNSQIQRFVIPKKDIEKVASKIQNGDIIALATNIKGLDFVHTGFAVFQGGKLHLLHASSKAGKVIVSPKSLLEYVKIWKQVEGIVVLRIKNKKR